MSSNSGHVTYFTHLLTLAMILDKSLFCHILGKILEGVQPQLNQKDITIRSSQHGFTNGRSTTSALTSITQPWLNATDNTCRDKSDIHALFIDFKKAFGLGDHGILLNKLAQIPNFDHLRPDDYL